MSIDSKSSPATLTDSGSVATPTTTLDEPPARGRLVWDLPLRLVHWALAVCFVGSWITAEAGFEWTEVHFRFGYTTLALVLFRLMWGLFGPAHARFSGFVRGPKAVAAHIRHLRESRLGESSYVPSAGHNPLGALAVLALLLALLTQATTGLFISDDIFYAGPYNPAVSGDTAGRLASIHGLNFHLLQALVALHLLAIGWYYLRQKENLVKPMFTGRKDDPRLPRSSDIGSSQLLKAALIAGLVGLFVWWLLANAPPPSIDDYY